MATANKPAGPVSAAERAQAREQSEDVEAVVKLGMTAATRVSLKTRSAVLAAYQSGLSVLSPIRKGLAEWRELLVQAMVVAELKAMKRTVAGLPATLSLARSPLYTATIAQLVKRQKLTEEQLSEIETVVDAHVVRVLADTTKAIQDSLLKEVKAITREGLHVRDGVKQLREKWALLGLDERNSFQIEAVFRTQTQFAYSAGQQAVLADPDIDEILWGHKYVTVGDDRVRDRHRGLDGVTLPKKHQLWQTIMTPNGFACRCGTIPIYEKRKSARPRGGAGPDEGFEFNPGDILKTKKPIPIPAA